MAKIGEFEVFLVIGLLILLSLVIVFNLVNTPGTTPFEVNRTQSKVFDTSIHAVGANFNDAVKTHIFTFTAANLREVTTVALDPVYLENGIFFSSDRFTYRVRLDDVDSVTVTFVIGDTNGLAPLVVTFGGTTLVEDTLEPGVYSYTVDASVLSEFPVLEIYPQSSGWKIWAPTVYRIDSIDITSEGFHDERFQTRFSVDREYDSFTEGKIDLVMEQNIGSIHIELNHKALYEGALRKTQSISFDKEDIQKGESILTIEANEDSSFRGRATLSTFYQKLEEEVLRVPLALSASEIEKITTGSINFEIIDVVRPGGFTIRIINNNEILFEDFAVVKEGRESFGFTKEHLKPGLNRIIITGLSGAGFKITDFDVRI